MLSSSCWNNWLGCNSSYHLKSTRKQCLTFKCLSNSNWVLLIRLMLTSREGQMVPLEQVIQAWSLRCLWLLEFKRIVKVLLSSSTDRQNNPELTLQRHPKKQSKASAWKETKWSCSTVGPSSTNYVIPQPRHSYCSTKFQAQPSLPSLQELPLSTKIDGPRMTKHLLILYLNLNSD